MPTATLDGLAREPAAREPVTAEPVTAEPATPGARRRLFRNGWEIAWMVIAFVVFWPAGLALLAYYTWRPDMSCMIRRVERAARRSFPAAAGFLSRDAAPASSGNSAFDAYRAEVLARLEAERRKLDEEQRAFGDFLEGLRRQKDREAFDRFMARRRGAEGDGSGSGGDTPAGRRQA